jgi:hypothetical protein
MAFSELVEPLAKVCDFGLAPLLQNFLSGMLGALARCSRQRWRR